MGLAPSGGTFNSGVSSSWWLKRTSGGCDTITDEECRPLAETSEEMGHKLRNQPE